MNGGMQPAIRKSINRTGLRGMAASGNGRITHALGIQNLLEHIELQPFMKIFLIQHGAEDSAKPGGSAEEINVLADKTDIRAGRRQFSFCVKIAGLFGLVHYIHQIKGSLGYEFLRTC